MSFYVIRFVSFTNFKAIIFWSQLDVSSSLNIKNRHKIGERGNPYRMPVSVNIFLLL